jgi:N-acetylglutamate synthase-like GNAT family acetyltransferase
MIEIRQAAESDIDRLVDLIRRSYAVVAEQLNLNEKDHPRCTSFYTAERMKDDFDKGIKYYILQDNKKAIGCVAMEKADEDICYLMRLAVLPQYRKQGFGKKLVKHIFEEAKKEKLKQVQIGIVAEAIRLKNWYKNLGFAQFKTQKFNHLPFLVAFMSAELWN